MKCPGQGSSTYHTADIQVFEGLEHVRRRPAMYLGGTGERDLHFLLSEVVDSSLAAIGRGEGTAVRVTLCADGYVEVEDDGVLPADVERQFGALYYGHGQALVPGERSQWAYTIANALSAQFTARVRTPGGVYQHTFRRGRTEAAMQLGGPGARGLAVRFRPDPDIFGAHRFDPKSIRDRLRQCAYLHSGVHITFVDETGGTEDVWEYADGIAEYVKRLNAGRTPLHTRPFVIRGEAEGVRYEVGLQWCGENAEVCVTAANCWMTRGGGTHLTGFRGGYTRAVSEAVREHAPGWEKPTGEELRRGLTAVVSVWLPQPMFLSQFRAQLASLEAEGVVRSAVRRGLRDHFAASRELAAQVVRAAARARK